MVDADIARQLHPYRAIRGDQQWTSRSHLTQILKMTADETARNANLNVYIHFASRLTRYVCLQLAAIEGILVAISYNGVNKVSTAAVDSFWADDDDDNDADMTGDLYSSADDLWNNISSSNMKISTRQK